MNFKIKSPSTKLEYDAYYYFRWKMLRKEFNQPKGTEKDKLEKDSYHVMLINSSKVIIGVGRIHFLLNNSIKIAQIRYMAIHKDFQFKGFGTIILKELESYAKKNNINNIFLHSRSSAIEFYKKNEYKKKEKTHLLFNEVQHWLMEKVTL